MAYLKLEKIFIFRVFLNAKYIVFVVEVGMQYRRYSIPIKGQFMNKVLICNLGDDSVKNKKLKKGMINNSSQ